MKYTVELTEIELKKFLADKDKKRADQEKEFSSRVRLEKLLRLLDKIKTLPPGEWFYLEELTEALEFAAKCKEQGYYQ